MLDIFKAATAEEVARRQKGQKVSFISDLHYSNVTFAAAEELARALRENIDRMVLGHFIGDFVEK